MFGVRVLRTLYLRAVLVHGQWRGESSLFIVSKSISKRLRGPLRRGHGLPPGWGGWLPLSSPRRWGRVPLLVRTPECHAVDGNINLCQHAADERGCVLIPSCMLRLRPRHSGRRAE